MSETVTLAVTGMKCGGCESNLTGKVKEIAGVVSVTASHKDKQVEVEFDTDQASLDEIKQAITDAGFTVE